MSSSSSSSSFSSFQFLNSSFLSILARIDSTSTYETIHPQSLNILTNPLNEFVKNFFIDQSKDLRLKPFTSLTLHSFSTDFLVFVSYIHPDDPNQQCLFFIQEIEAQKSCTIDISSFIHHMSRMYFITPTTFVYFERLVDDPFFVVFRDHQTPPKISQSRKQKFFTLIFDLPFTSTSTSTLPSLNTLQRIPYCGSELYFDQTNWQHIFEDPASSPYYEIKYAGLPSKLKPPLLYSFSPSSKKEKEIFIQLKISKVPPKGKQVYYECIRAQILNKIFMFNDVSKLPIYIVIKPKGYGWVDIIHVESASTIKKKKK